MEGKSEYGAEMLKNFFTKKTIEDVQRIDTTLIKRLPPRKAKVQTYRTLNKSPLTTVSTKTTF